jgi:hypothetical protein
MAMHDSDKIIKRITVERLKITGSIIYGFDLNTTNASAISVATPTTFITSAGAETRTLANGYLGQEKTIIAKATMTGTVTITPTNLANGTNVVMTAAGNSWTGVFYGGEWHTKTIIGATIT